MSANNKFRLARRIRLAGRIIVSVAVALLLMAGIGSAVSEGLPSTIVGATLGVLGVISLAGCILSWWRERLASILLIATSIGFGIHIGFFAGRNHLLAWSIVGLPYLVSAVLLYISWRLSRQNRQLHL